MHGIREPRTCKQTCVQFLAVLRCLSFFSPTEFGAAHVLVPHSGFAAPHYDSLCLYLSGIGSISDKARQDAGVI